MIDAIVAVRKPHDERSRPAAAAKALETLEKKDGFAKLPKEEQEKAIAAETKANLLAAWRDTVEKTPALTELGELQRQAQWRLDFVAAENSMGFHAPQGMARILAESIDLSRQAEIKAAALPKGPLAMNEPSPAPAGGKVAK
jgi:nitrite reductase (cytochrome c-552)